ncbi:MAG: pyrE 2 [Acidimicrobiaceae bacterium]|nr:pyrE 2 [Acidimicrobiaceae bacterium]
MDPSPSALVGRPVGAGWWRAPLVALVLEKGYVRRDEPFLLSSGGTSRDYVDLRRAVAEGPDLELAARAVLARLEELEVGFDSLGGMTMGADPVAHAVSLLGGRPWFSVRKAVKGHGSGRRIEGAVLDEQTRVVVFEDTVSTGRSALDALEVVRSVGAPVVLACTLLDRGEAASRAFAEAGVRYEPLLTYRDLGIDPLDDPPASPG